MGRAGKDAVAAAELQANTMMMDYQAQQTRAQINVAQQKKAYKDIDIVNPYVNMQNQ